MSELKVKHQYRVDIYWCNGVVETERVLAINDFQAKNKVVENSKQEGLYDNVKSTAKIEKHNVAVVRA